MAEENEDYVTPQKATLRRCSSKTSPSSSVKVVEPTGKQHKFSTAIEFARHLYEKSKSKGNGKGNAQALAIASKPVPSTGWLSKPKRPQGLMNRLRPMKSADVYAVASPVDSNFKKSEEVEEEEEQMGKAKDTKRKKKSEEVEEEEEQMGKVKDASKRKKKSEEVEEEEEQMGKAKDASKRKKKSEEVEEEEEQMGKAKDASKGKKKSKEVEEEEQMGKAKDESKGKKKSKEAQEKGGLDASGKKTKEEESKARKAAAKKEKQPEVEESQDIEDLPPDERRKLKAQDLHPAKEKKSKGASKEKPGDLSRSNTSATVHAEDGVGVVKIQGLTVRDEKGTLRRVKVLSPELKEQVKNLKDQSQVDVQDRRVIYGAIDRKMKQKGMPAELLKKYQEAAGSHSKKFELLKEFLLSDELRNVTLEASVSQTQRTKDDEVYCEMTMVDLERKYAGTESGRAYLETLKKTQRGRPHPRKEFKKVEGVRLYKVFKHTISKSGTENKSSTKVSSVANLPDPDEIGEAGFEGVTKAVGSIIDDMRPLLAKKSDKNKKRKRDSSGSSDRSRRRRRGKDDKPDEEKKEENPEDKDKKDLNKNIKGIRSLAGRIRTASGDLHTFPGNEETKTKLIKKHKLLNGAAERLEAMTVEGSTTEEVLHEYASMKTKLEKAEDLLDTARSMYRSLKARQKKKDKKAEEAKEAKKAAKQEKKNKKR